MYRKEVTDVPFIEKPNCITYEEGGERLAEVDFPATGSGAVEITHTFVNEALRGRGVAGQLMEHAVSALRGDGRRATLTCSFAQKWFDEHPEARDVLAK